MNSTLRVAATAVIATFQTASSDEFGDLQQLPDVLPRHYVAHRTSGPILVDGRLDEPSWQRISWTGEFVYIEEGDKSPDLSTHAKIIWDDEFLYIAADLEEPHLWATVHRRDDLVYDDNDFEVFINPDGDTHEYYEFDPPLRDVRKPWPRVQPDTLGFGYKDYGNRVGVWRIMEVLDRYEIRASISLNVAVCDHHPEITHACYSSNNCCHKWTNKDRTE